jgi:predicted dehydrogenase
VSDNVTHDFTRRQVLTTAGAVVAAGTLAGVSVPAVHAQGNDNIRVALVGCGGRGTGAALNALSTRGPTTLHAMADVFQNRMDDSYKTLQAQKEKQMDVTKRRFIGFDAYREAMDTLRRGDVVILATPPAFRWPHYRYAIEKDLNVFMEKPPTVDGPSSRRLLALNQEAIKKNLKVSVGLMCRHCTNRQELHRRIRDGQIGDILMMRSYRMHGPIGTAHVGRKPDKMSDLLYQVRNFHAFLWASGGCYSDFLIHNIDECCWMKDAWPVRASGYGGRHYRGNNVDQNFDTYSIEYTFEDGTKLFLEGRTIEGCRNEFASYAHGTRNSAVISRSNHASGRCPIYKGQVIERDHRGRRVEPIWIAEREEPDKYQAEWHVLMDAIRNNRRHNEVERGVQASVVTVMGRLAAHTGQDWTYDDTLNHPHEFAPNVDRLRLDGDAPLRADQDGRYPVPEPGRLRDREYRDPNEPKKNKDKGKEKDKEPKKQ